MRGRLPARALAATLGAAVLTGCGQYSDLHQPEVAAAPALVAYGDGLTVGERARFDVGGLDDAGGPDRTAQHTSDRTAERARTGEREGPLLACPVRGRGYYTSSFGAYRAGPPVHRHQGNDLFAAYGTPIVAPFDGVAEATRNTLGGKGVRVYGADGYVYNAHLSRYGRLGKVEVGDVIGFVGDSGNASASAPHDHFEWHPDDGPAVDPFPVLNEACPAG